MLRASSEDLFEDCELIKPDNMATGHRFDICILRVIVISAAAAAAALKR